MKNLFNILVLILTVLIIQSCKEDKPTPPIITTTAVSAISYTTATSGGNATDEGGAPIVSKGVCWNISAEPTVDNSKTSESSGLGTFASNLTQLTPNTMYYVRAYATNSAGTGYGNQVTFTTLQVEVPVLATTAVTSITQTTAVSGGNVTDDKGGSVTARGVCWGIATNPTTADSKTTDGSGTGSFVSNLSDLQAGTLYYVRAYSTNNVGTAYGNEISFTTLPATTPILITTDITNITQNTATCGGTITSDGAASITARGICWSTSQNPTISDSKTYDDTGTGTYTSSLTGLIGNTTYFVSAYATNSAGTAYGNEISFTTLPVIVTAITLNSNSITLQTSDTSQLTATVLPSNASDKTVSWTSSNTSIATVSSTGLVTALAKGTTTITAQTNDGGKTATCEIIVAQLLSGIINSDVDVGENNVVSISGTVQIASGVTLNIGQGTVLYGNGYEIQNFGNFIAIGTTSKKIIINNLKLVPKTGNFIFNLQYCIYNSGSIYSPTGNAIYGHLILKYCEFNNLSSYFYLWYPITGCIIEGNLFNHCGGFTILTRDAIITIKNNRFVNMTRTSIELQANYAAPNYIVVQGNSFMDTGIVQIKITGGGYAGKDIDASNNYWNTISETVIKTMIYDKNNDLSSPGYVLYTPFLTSPDSATP